MAPETESAEQKNSRLHKMLHEAVDELFSRKIGNRASFGESRVVVIWKEGRVSEIRVEDSASIR